MIARKDILTVLDAADYIRSIAEVRNTYHQRRLENSMSSESTQYQTYIIPDEETASFSKGLLSALSPAAMKLAIQIGDDLYMNNALWYFDHQNNRSHINALKELKEKRILFSLEHKFFYVNPLCIRKGNAVVVAEKTKEIILDNRGVSMELLKNLGSKMKGEDRPLLYLRATKLDLSPQL